MCVCAIFIIIIARGIKQISNGVMNTNIIYANAKGFLICDGILYSLNGFSRFMEINIISFSGYAMYCRTSTLPTFYNNNDNG